MEKKNGWHRETHRNFHKAQDSTEATTCVQWSNKDWLTVHPIGAHVTPTWHLVSLPAGGEVWLGVQNHADNMPTRLLLHVSYHLTSQDYPQNAYASTQGYQRRNSLQGFTASLRGSQVYGRAQKTFNYSAKLDQSTF